MRIYRFLPSGISKMQANDHGSANKNEWLRQHSIVFAIACDMRGKQEWDEKYSNHSKNSLLKLPAKIK